MAAATESLVAQRPVPRATRVGPGAGGGRLDAVAGSGGRRWQRRRLRDGLWVAHDERAAALALDALPFPLGRQQRAKTTSANDFDRHECPFCLEIGDAILLYHTRRVHSAEWTWRQHTLATCQVQAGRRGPTRCQADGELCEN